MSGNIQNNNLSSCVNQNSKDMEKNRAKYNNSKFLLRNPNNMKKNNAHTRKMPIRMACSPNSIRLLRFNASYAPNFMSLKMPPKLAYSKLATWTTNSTWLPLAAKSAT